MIWLLLDCSTLYVYDVQFIDLILPKNNFSGGSSIRVLIVAEDKNAKRKTVENWTIGYYQFNRATFL